jgi:predicted house-cleaning noncanonical NTP pyrophosphatase (MazG superfamily)
MYCHVTITSKHLRAGCEIHTFDEWKNKTEEEITEMDGNKALEFYPKLLKIIELICN